MHDRNALCRFGLADRRSMGTLSRPLLLSPPSSRDLVLVLQLCRQTTPRQVLST